jgi:hypothetical protein
VERTVPAAERLEVGHAFAPAVRRRARRLVLVAVLLGLALLVAVPEQWPFAAAAAMAVAGLGIAATRLSRLVVTVDPDGVLWCESGLFPGFAHTVRIPREGVDQLYVGERPPSLADRATPVPATVRVAFPRHPEYAAQVVPRRFQLWVIRDQRAVAVVEHPDPELLRAIERAAERLWAIVDRPVDGELQR